MSLTAFKRKSVINHGSKRSGLPPGGFWLPQGPFGHSTAVLKEAIHQFGASGFSLQGGHRSAGGVGRDMKMSKSGTPYRGLYPVGFGGTYGTYPSATLVGSVTDDGVQSTGAVPNEHSKLAAVEPVLNARVTEVMGTQYMYVKPSVLSNYGMLNKKYRWARHGTYPNYWVQPNYTGNQTDSASQQQYIQKKASANTCNLKVNNVATYVGNECKCSPVLCKSGRTLPIAYYTKTLYQPVTYSQYNQYVARGCNNPVGAQKPFPFAVQTGKSMSASGTSIRSSANGCGTSNIYLTPPEWYTHSRVSST